MRRTLSAVAAALLLAGSVTAFAPTASAENGRIAAGVAGGLIGGMLLGGAIANANQPPPPPVYYRGGPPAYYVDEPPPVCTIQQQQFWDGFMWRIRNVRVCQPYY